MLGPAFSFEMSPLLAYFSFGLKLIIELSYLHRLHFELASASGFVTINRPKDFQQSKLRLTAVLVDYHHQMLSFRLASSSDSTIPTDHQNSAANPTSNFA